MSGICNRTGSDGVTPDVILVGSGVGVGGSGVDVGGSGVAVTSRVGDGLGVAVEVGLGVNVGATVAVGSAEAACIIGNV